MGFVVSACIVYTVNHPTVQSYIDKRLLSEGAALAVAVPEISRFPMVVLGVRLDICPTFPPVYVLICCLNSQCRRSSALQRH